MRYKSLLLTLGLALLFSACLKDDSEIDEDSLSNKDRMRLLEINDPSIWNTLTEQSINLSELEETTALVKSAAAMQEYPKNNKYYFALFEDLYPSEGDYDFNDVMIKSKLGLSKKGNTITGYVSSELYNKGGSLSVKVGLMFYEVSGKAYTRIANENIIVNGEQLTAGGSPWMRDLSELDDSWQIDFSFTNNSNNIWVSYFIYTDEEILTGGFAKTGTTNFEVPVSDFLTDRNLPWGLEVETDEFAIPNEKELFLNAYPEFEAWAESGGVKNKKWYESPNTAYSHY
ncbi:LruC domain-containing protein [Maribellus maritimus]|uniref:LruC domain-containing protein n=1 Tax=Maribellus maritimus TaxID=2870838 RepID=UPI001EEA42EE|nr:LruC domain-containing protein [Maribellus maritimus]MCG6189676.1 LruC domain-containing protein [Maribellus maritimus]